MRVLGLLFVELVVGVGGVSGFVLVAAGGLDLLICVVVLSLVWFVKFDLWCFVLGVVILIVLYGLLRCRCVYRFVSVDLYALWLRCGCCEFGMCF